MTTTREAHLSWAKRRALQYCEAGDLPQAWASMVSDIQKHPETQMHPAIQLGTQLLIAGHLDTTETMRRFIEGFN